MLTVAERPDGPVDAVLKARVFRGRVIDSEGAGLPDAIVRTKTSTASTDQEGHFTIRGAEPGEVRVERPAWVSTAFRWEGTGGEAVVELAPFQAKAVHVTGPAVVENYDAFLKMAATTELNSLMIDLKDERGLIFYDTSSPTALEANARVEDGYNLERVVAAAHARDLYVIGRIVLFSDPIVAKAIPEMAVWDSATNAPFHANDQYFLDPTDPEARQYGLDLAVEACEAGVDEIQFDYVRFPDFRTETSVFDEGSGDEVRRATINGLLTEAVVLLRPKGCAVAADVFGFLTTARDDGGIGQQWEDVTSIVDVVSPMVYASHYSEGWYGFEDPNQHPGPVVSYALADGLQRLGGNAVVRPWLQDFGYSDSQVRAQIESAEELGLGWMLWNAVSDVTVTALNPPS